MIDIIDEVRCVKGLIFFMLCLIQKKPVIAKYTVRNIKKRLNDTDKSTDDILATIKKKINPVELQNVLLQNGFEPSHKWDKRINCIDPGLKEENINASCALLRRKKYTIFINRAWEEQIVKNEGNIRMEEALQMTLCHELTHMEKKRYLNLGYMIYKNNFQFIHWVDEVYADFGGCQKAFGTSKEKVINAMEYKQECLKEGHDNKNIDSDKLTHPSNKRRLTYILNYKYFDSNLIKQIAKDCEEMNSSDRPVDKELIMKIIKYYLE